MSAATPALHSERTVDISTSTAMKQNHPGDLIDQLKAMSFRGLARMYDRNAGSFYFRVDRTADGIVPRGHSARYTAITLLGLASESGPARDSITAPHSIDEVCARLLKEVSAGDNLGDVALSIWAAGLLGHAEATYEAARRLAALSPLDRVHPVVELAWTLVALTLVPQADKTALRDAVAKRLMSVFNPGSALFPHIAGGAGARAHVACFADIIYPIQALSLYSTAAGNQQALDIASRCATHLCSTQGEAGQWWWHYDYRTGAVIEGYPVYAIHQDAMGPMGLHDLREAGGPDCLPAIVRGLEWLTSAPELSGGSLIDTDADLVWRKVARREPRKAARYVQAAASRVHPSLRVPALDVVFPAVAIDFEDRPYHLGWLLHAWQGPRVAALKAQKGHA